MNKIVLGLMFLIASNVVLAGSTWSGRGRVVDVMSHDGAVVLRTEISSSDACLNGGAFWWSTNDPDSNNMFAIALAALASDMKIAVVYNTSALNCNHGNSAEIKIVSISH